MPVGTYNAPSPRSRGGKAQENPADLASLFALALEHHKEGATGGGAFDDGANGGGWPKGTAHSQVKATQGQEGTATRAAQQWTQAIGLPYGVRMVVRSSKAPEGMVDAWRERTGEEWPEDHNGPFLVLRAFCEPCVDDAGSIIPSADAPEGDA